MIIFQYLYAVGLFGGFFFLLWQGIKLSFRFAHHVWDVSRRFSGGPR